MTDELTDAEALDYQLTALLYQSRMTPYDDGKGDFLYRHATSQEQAAAVLASDWLADRLAVARAEALTEAADELRLQAVARLDTHGAHDARGAALWDAACHINPDDGDALRARAAAVARDGEGS